MTRMTSEEARERIAQADRWEALCMSCSVPGVGQDHPRFYAARALGAMHHEWRAMVLRDMPMPTQEDLQRWAPIMNMAHEELERSSGVNVARWECVLSCLKRTPQRLLEAMLRLFAEELTPGEDIDARAAQDARAYCQAAILAREEDHA